MLLTGHPSRDIIADYLARNAVIVNAHDMLPSIFYLQWGTVRELQGLVAQVFVLSSWQC